MPRTFKPHIRIFLGIDSCNTIFAKYVDALMCILVGKCPTIIRFSTSYFDGMATNHGLDRELM
jgi:hypothetical protein